MENVNVPGHTTRVDGVKYADMRQALLRVLPSSSPGLSQSEMFDAVLPFLSEAIFPGGKTARWWVKCVQLDLEAKGLVDREACKPIRWRQR